MILPCAVAGTAESQPAAPRPVPIPFRLLLRHAGFEGLLTSALLFLVVTLVRWCVGPSWLARSAGSLQARVALVGAGVAVVVWLLIISPLGRRTGGHMNPAVTLAMWGYGVFPIEGVPAYIAAQLAGSTLGVIVGEGVWGASARRPPVSDAVIQPAPGWSGLALFGVEAAGMTVILLVIGWLLAHPRLTRQTPIVVGLLVGGAIAGLGTFSGGSENPARQFGPALISGQARFLWIYLLAPMVGACLAPLLHTRLWVRRPRSHFLHGGKRLTVSGQGRRPRRPPVGPSGSI